MIGRIERHIALSAALAAGLLLACFSETPETTAVAKGECPPLGVDSEAFGSVVVAIRGFSFGPDTIRIAPGTRVTWINCEPKGTEAHTVTSDEGDFLDSPLFERGGTYSRTFDGPGAFPYHCIPHPFMKATVLVE